MTLKTVYRLKDTMGIVRWNPDTKMAIFKGSEGVIEISAEDLSGIMIKLIKEETPGTKKTGIIIGGLLIAILIGCATYAGILGDMIEAAVGLLDKSI